jgi:hypothetical protein
MCFTKNDNISHSISRIANDDFFARQASTDVTNHPLALAINNNRNCQQFNSFEHSKNQKKIRPYRRARPPAAATTHASAASTNRQCSLGRRQ